MDKHVSTLREVCWERDKTLIVKMTTNCSLVESTNTNVLNLCDIVTILGLPCKLPMLEFVYALMKFAQAIDVFVCDYIVIIKICTKCVDIQTFPSRLQTFLSLLMWL
jgi:hypothetical protein